MRKSYSEKDGRKTFKEKIKLKKESETRIYSLDGRLLYILKRGESIDYQELCKNIVKKHKQH